MIEFMFYFPLAIELTSMTDMLVKIGKNNQPTKTTNKQTNQTPTPF